MTRRYLTAADLDEFWSTAHRPAGGRATPGGPTAEATDFSASTRTSGGGQTVHSITSTPEARSTDMGRRMKVYGIQMALRVFCFFGFVLIDNPWWRIACVIGMVVLPWSAVLLANAGADRSERSSNYLGPELLPELTKTSTDGPPSTTESPGDDEPAGPEGPSGSTGDVVDGEWSEGPRHTRR